MALKWFSGPIGKLETLVASSAKFQSETGAGNAAAALAFIDKYQSNRTVGDDGMFAIIGSAGGRTRVKQAAGTYSNEGGELFVVFVRPTASGNVNDDEAAAIAFADVVEEILDEMESLAGTDDFLNVVSWEETEPITQGDDDYTDGQKHWWCEIGVGIQ